MSDLLPFDPDILLEAFLAHDAGEYGVREFQHLSERWVLSISAGHIELRRVAPAPADLLFSPQLRFSGL